MVKHLVEDKSLPEFFREEVESSCSKLHVHPSPEAEHYLVELLTSFTQSDNFHERDANGELADKALALQYFESFFQSNYDKFRTFKKMGDLALYVTGFFADSLFKKIVGADYYVRMGEAAYASIPSILPHESGKALGPTYAELSSHFLRFADVLSDVAERSHLHSDKSLLMLYERWLKTGSERTRQLLMEKGLVPDNNLKTGYTM